MLLVDLNNCSLLTFSSEVAMTSEESHDYLELLLQVTHKTLKQKTPVRKRARGHLCSAVVWCCMCATMLRTGAGNWNSSQVAA